VARVALVGLALGRLDVGVHPRDARVLVLYPDSRAVQYGRDVWVPPHAALTAWLPVGPAPQQPSALGRDVEALLYDRTGGQDRLVLPPGEEAVVRVALVVDERMEPGLEYRGELSVPDLPGTSIPIVARKTLAA
jgi:hypothetical protein